MALQQLFTHVSGLVSASLNASLSAGIRIGVPSLAIALTGPIVLFMVPHMSDLASAFTFICLFSFVGGGIGGLGLTSLCWSAGLTLWQTYQICGGVAGIWGFANYLFTRKMR